MRLGLLIVALSLAAGTGQAQTVDAADPASVVAAMQAEGFKAKLGKFKDGRPKIESATDGDPFTIQFDHCEGTTKCKSLVFFAWYKKQPYYTVALANAFNTEKYFARTYIDKDGDLVIDYLLSTVGGVPRATFADTLDWWQVMNGELDKFLEARKPPNKPADIAAPSSAVGG